MLIAECDNDISVKNTQEDLDLISKWCKTWLMNLNASTCKVMHMRKSNLNAKYTINGVTLESSTSEKDLGVFISSNLKWSNLVQTISTRANRILGMLKHLFRYKHPGIWKQLYSALVRPHLEYAVQAWRPTAKEIG